MKKGPSTLCIVIRSFAIEISFMNFWLKPSSTRQLQAVIHCITAYSACAINFKTVALLSSLLYAIVEILIYTWFIAFLYMLPAFHEVKRSFKVLKINYLTLCYISKNLRHFKVGITRFYCILLHILSVRWTNFWSKIKIKFSKNDLTEKMKLF